MMKLRFKRPIVNLQRSIISIIFLAAVTVYYSVSGCAPTDPLNPEERAWLNQNNGNIIVNNESGWPPIIDTDKDGKPYGIVIDFQHLLEKKLHFKFKLDRPDSWKNFMKRFRNGEIDVNNNLQKSPQRSEYALFTKPYIEIPNAIIVRKETEGSLTMDKLRGMTIAVTNNFAIHEHIKNNYGYLKLLPLESDLQCLLETSMRNTDVAVVNLAVASFLIEQKGISNLRVAGYADYSNALCFASRKDLPILNRILEKGLSLISAKERNAIFNKWISLGYVPFYKSGDFWIVSGAILAILITFIVLVLAWNKSLKQQVAARTKSLELINKQLSDEIQERKHVESALRTSEEKYRELTEFLPIAIFELDHQAKVIYANKAAFQSTGYHQKDIDNGMDILQLVAPQDQERAVNRAQQVMQGELTEGSEYLIMKKDGSTYSGYVNTRPTQAENPGLIGYIFDLTRLKETEKALLDSERKYRQLFNNAPAGIYEIDFVTGKFINVNDVMCTSIGYTEEEFLSLNPADLLTENSKRLLAQRLEKLSAGEKISDNVEFTIVRKDGKELNVLLNNDFVYENNQIVGARVVVHDITERKQLEEELRQSQKMESIGILAGGIAHDFNNILGIIVGNTELALDDVPEWNPAHYNLAEIKHASVRAAGIVKQLLSFSRKTSQELKPLQISEVIVDALKLVRSTIPTTIQIRKNIPAKDKIVLADPIQINQIILNLCVNAAYEMEKTGGVFEVAVESVTLDEEAGGTYPDLAKGDYVKISVSDNGPGIAPENIDKIFDPYFTTKEVGKGTGMGLAVVHGIVKSHNGAITVESQRGKGSTFNILFPVFAGTPTSEAETGKETPRGKESILFVDDEQSIVDVTKQMLERLGYKVEAKVDSFEALELFRSKPDQFDLVITDMTMPQITGIHLSEKILAIRSDVPIIICTGYSSLIDEEKARNTGIAAHVMKPIAKQEIARTIRSVLDRSYPTI